ncbi:MAG TPA: phosphatidylinositol-specific phospholipase C1-like protein [Candidatus Eisenbacteria bacterium]|nr:phosphatidylinositol-specific phospholipase C1-like protein [Candidatus Eisenbacteria bacterium]
MRHLGSLVVALALVADLRSAMAREVLRATPKQCLRLEKRVAGAELRAQANPTGARAQAKFYSQSRKYATRCVHLNEIQVLGTHNSYHVRPLEPLWSALLAFLPELSQLDYTHIPLDQQFSDQGIRQIELDVSYDPNGGLYADRIIMALFGLPTASGIPALDQPGFKVLHLNDIDFQSTCYTFVECLQQVKTWSDARPWHLPITILVEAKDDPTPDPLGIGFVTPLLFTPAAFDALDAEIRSVFPPERIITPDLVRGSFATLEEAVLATGWPTLGEARGKVMFLLDNGGHYKADYLAGHPALAGRILFTDANPGDPDAGFSKQNDPLAPAIPGLVAQGYVVRTRADADTLEARAGNTVPRDTAIASGAQWVSTDYPVPNPAFGTGYFVAIPDGHPARCNPVNAPGGCRSTALE